MKRIRCRSLRRSTRRARFPRIDRDRRNESGASGTQTPTTSMSLALTESDGYEWGVHDPLLGHCENLSSFRKCSGHSRWLIAIGSHGRRAQRLGIARNPNRLPPTMLPRINGKEPRRAGVASQLNVPAAVDHKT